ncbi:MAG: hypothetical protein LQ346_005878 [Caloplaca aetnensis]|nr:MAG: hypothetical protein LQ346_005878 [Caloplaca aetnensis]
MSEPIPANAVWRWDYIDHYRLGVDIIDGYLREKWGNYKYLVKVIGSFRMGSSGRRPISLLGAQKS